MINLSFTCVLTHFFRLMLGTSVIKLKVPQSIFLLVFTIRVKKTIYTKKQTILILPFNSHNNICQISQKNMEISKRGLGVFPVKIYKSGTLCLRKLKNIVFKLGHKLYSNNFVVLKTCKPAKLCLQSFAFFNMKLRIFQKTQSKKLLCFISTFPDHS